MRVLLPFLASASLLAQLPSSTAPGPKVQETPLRAHLAFLADDLLEGRGTGQRGAELTVRYLETQLQSLGLSPAQGHTYRQPVSLLGLQTLVGRSTLSFLGGGACTTPKFGPEIVFGAGVAKAEQTFDAPVVFVGYGIDAPEYQWNDYKGLDVRGKILLMLVNEPAPTAVEPGLFDGANLSAYGRWTTKFEMAARHGATGVLLIHTTPSASYGWSVVRNGWDAERFSLAQGPVGAPLEGWVTEDLAKALVTLAGKELEALRAAAQQRGFQPVPLELTLKGTLHSTVRTVAQFNVAGVVPGTDPALKEELLIYSAHWDHLGKKKGGSLGDDIYNGAADNATGCGLLLELARAWGQMPTKPKRSAVFLAVTAEEKGLLGSKHYVQTLPEAERSKIAAMLNFDMVGRLGADGLVVAGAGTSKVWPGLIEGNRGDLVVRTTDDGYGPSDHGSFYEAKIPVLHFFTGPHEDYHKPSDDLDKINYDGAATVANLASGILAALQKDAIVPDYIEVARPAARGGGFNVSLGTIPDYGAKVDGVRMSGVRAGGAAAKAGVVKGDVITKLGTRGVHNLDDYMAAFAEMKPNVEIPITIVRDGKPLELRLVPEAPKSK